MVKISADNRWYGASSASPYHVESIHEHWTILEHLAVDARLTTCGNGGRVGDCDPTEHYSRPCYRVNVTTPRRNRLPTLNLVWKPYEIAHSEMRDVNDRYESFDDNNTQQQQHYLTYAWAGQGFFADPDQRRRSGDDLAADPEDLYVRCFACGTLFYDWRFTDEPLREHCRLQPQCLLAASLYKRICRIRIQRRLAYFSTNECAALPPPPFNHHLRGMERGGAKCPDKTASFALALADQRARLDTFKRSTYWRRHWCRAETLSICGFVPIGEPIFRLHTFRRTLINRPSTYSGLRFAAEEDIGVDAVQCFSCGLVLFAWTDEACPWTEHAAWSPNCTHVYPRLKRNEK